jgi:hypothetical protein
MTVRAATATRLLKRPRLDQSPLCCRVNTYVITSRRKPREVPAAERGAGVQAGVNSAPRDRDHYRSASLGAGLFSTLVGA